MGLTIWTAWNSNILFCFLYFNYLTACHNVWKSNKMSHFNFSIWHFSSNFDLLKVTYSSLRSYCWMRLFLLFSNIVNVLWPQRLIVDTKVIMPHWVYSNFSLILLLGDLVACADDGVIRNSKKTKRKWNMNALLPHISLLFSSWMNRATTQLIHWVWPILLNKKDYSWKTVLRHAKLGALFTPLSSHSVWKSPKMSHLCFSISAFSTNLCPFLVFFMNFCSVKM